MQLHAGVVYEVSGSEIVRCVHYNVVSGYDFFGVFFIQEALIRTIFAIGVQFFEVLCRHDGFRHVFLTFPIQYLPLQIAYAYLVIVHKPYSAHACRCKVERNYGTQSADAYNKTGGTEKDFLSPLPEVL